VTKKMLTIFLFGLHNFASWTAHSASWTQQNWLDCAVGIWPATLHRCRIL